MIYYDKIPPDMRESIDAWVMTARPVGGGCLEAILCNDLMKAFDRAGYGNTEEMADIVWYLVKRCPEGSYGSPERYRAWPTMAGMFSEEDRETIAHKLKHGAP